VLDRLVVSAGAGQSGCWFLTARRGVGKTALLGYLVERASGCPITRVAGVKSETELTSPGCISSALPSWTGLSDSLIRSVMLPARCSASGGGCSGPLPGRLSRVEPVG
jgi:hypothetical protein